MSEKNYIGCAFKESSHYWCDGMLSEYIHVWDVEKHEEKKIECGYYGSDCRNMYDNSYNDSFYKNIPKKIDITSEVARDMIRTYKQRALKDYCRIVTKKRNKVQAGTVAEVIRGRKVKKGLILEVFWCDKKYNMYSRQDEYIAGCRLPGASKEDQPIWIKAEYLRVLNKPASPNKKERKKFLKTYLKECISSNVFEAARA